MARDEMEGLFLDWHCLIWNVSEKTIVAAVGDYVEAARPEPGLNWEECEKALWGVGRESWRRSFWFDLWHRHHKCTRYLSAPRIVLDHCFVSSDEPTKRPLVQGLDAKIGSYKPEKKRRKKEMNLNRDPPIKAPACIDDRPIDNGVWRKERKSQKKNRWSRRSKRTKMAPPLIISLVHG